MYSLNADFMDIRRLVAITVLCRGLSCLEIPEISKLSRNFCHLVMVRMS